MKTHAYLTPSSRAKEELIDLCRNSSRGKKAVSSYDIYSEKRTCWKKAEMYDQVLTRSNERKQFTFLTLFT